MPNDSISKKLQNAFSLFDEGLIDKAKDIYLTLLKDEAALTPSQQRSLYSGLIYVCCDEKEFDQALVYAEKLSDISIGFEARHIALHQTAMVHRLSGHYQEAIRVLEEEQVLIRQNGGEPMKLAANQYELGMVSLLTNQLSLARKHLDDALSNAEQSGDPITLGCVYRATGQLKEAGSEICEARFAYHQALKYFNEAGDQIACDEVVNLLQELES